MSDKMGFRLEVVGEPRPDRDERVRRLAELGFDWADLEEERYWIDQAVAVDESTYTELRDASATLWRIFDKTARFVIGRRDLYRLLSVPEVLWDALDRIAPNPPGEMSRYARFDFALSDEDGIKLLELNADTPTGYVEAAVATPWQCRQLGLRSPNEGMAAHVRGAWSKERPDAVACIGYGEHREDSGTVRMLARHSGLQPRMVDCLDLWVDEGVLKDGEDRGIRSLFALYPKEWMAVDEGGEALAYAIETGSLSIHNSIHAVLLQSKGLQALIWGFHELDHPFFDASEHETIARYMLPTYNKAVFDGDFVSKSMFGREGGSVQLFGADGRLEEEDKEGFDTSVFFSRVFQKRTRLAALDLAPGRLHLLTGMFVIDGQPCGLLGRAGGPITGNRSHFIAMGVRKA